MLIKCPFCKNKVDINLRKCSNCNQDIEYVNSLIQRSRQNDAEAMYELGNVYENYINTLENKYTIEYNYFFARFLYCYINYIMISKNTQKDNYIQAKDKLFEYYPIVNELKRKYMKADEISKTSNIIYSAYFFISKLRQKDGKELIDKTIIDFHSEGIKKIDFYITYLDIKKSVDSLKIIINDIENLIKSYFIYANEIKDYNKYFVFKKYVYSDATSQQDYIDMIKRIDLKTNRNENSASKFEKTKNKEAKEILILENKKQNKEFQRKNNHISKTIKRINDFIDSISNADDIKKSKNDIEKIREFLAKNKWAMDKIANPQKLKKFYMFVDNAKRQSEIEQKEKNDALFASFMEMYLNKDLYYEDGTRYRKGKIVALRWCKIPKSVYVDVYFSDTNEIKKWIIPDSINNGYVSLINKWTTKDKKDMSYVEKETIKEKKYLEIVIDACKTKIEAEYKAKPTEYTYNPYDDNYDPQEIADKMATDTMQSYWRKVSMSPFFASLKTKSQGIFYIGKYGINDLVIDWRDPKCSIYYNYSTALADKKIGLIYIREHEIDFRKYKGFIDKFNFEREDYKERAGFNVSNLNDKYLIKLLENSRNQKITHDIILTIQANQYNIISNTAKENLLVTGCAGSGKTMVLFHRIAYLAFNDVNFNPYEYLIVSSNKLLKNEADMLSEELQLNKIRNFDTYGFYYDFVKYCIGSSNSCFLLDSEYEGIMKNEKAYSVEYLEKLYKLTNEFALLDDKGFYEFYFNKIRDATEQILKHKIIDADDLKNIIVENEHILDLLKNIPVENLNHAIEDERANFFLKYLSEYLGKYVVLNTKKEVSKPKKLTQFNNAINYCNDKKITYNLTTSYFDENVKSENSDLIYLYDVTFLLKMTRNFIDYFNGNYRPLAIEIIDYVISHDKELTLLNNSDKLFIYAYLLEKLGFTTKQKIRKIFIDEYQNYSKAELMLFKSLSYEGSLNLFGDENQKIESKGIDKCELSNLGEFKTFKLMVNYRNANQICKFMNESFDMSMIPIGVNGVVEIVAKLSNVKLDAEGNDSRTALIVKDINSINIDISDFNVVNSFNTKIVRNKINVISIENIKGLEFEKVYVLDNKLNNNERYLAYSRALNTLIIICDN